MVTTLYSASTAQTEQIGAKIGKAVRPGTVIALFGELGMGKTALTRGIAAGMGLADEVSSPTFALVNVYRGNPPLAHFDMYRVTGWDDLYATGYFDYLDAGAVLAIEWSENIENSLPDNAVRIRLTATDENNRTVTVDDADEVLGDWL